MRKSTVSGVAVFAAVGSMATGRAAVGRMSSMVGCVVGMLVGRSVGEAAVEGVGRSFIAATTGAGVAVASRTIVVATTGAAAGMAGRRASPATKATATSNSAMSEPSAQSAVSALRGTYRVIISPRRAPERSFCSSIGDLSPMQYSGVAAVLLSRQGAIAMLSQKMPGCNIRFQASGATVVPWCLYLFQGLTP